MSAINTPSVARARLEHASIPEPNTGCVLWTGSATLAGYGKLRFAGRETGAHRVAWMLHNEADIPAGLEILHACDTPACINPAHLSVGSRRDNMQDMIRKGRAGIRRPQRGQDHHSRRHPERIPRGSNHGRAKLNEAMVQSIHGLRRSGIAIRAISRAIPCVSRRMIMNILQGRSWKHVTMEI